jgi:hypothetical protein
MGVELHISRTPEGAEERVPISAEAWLTYVTSDPELQLWPEQGPYFVRWLGESAHEDPWLDWFDGEISSKWPDTALYRKMLTIAEALGARVRDDDDTTYALPTDWQFEPNAAKTRLPTPRPWWKRIFGGGA